MAERKQQREERSPGIGPAIPIVSRRHARYNRRPLPIDHLNTAATAAADRRGFVVHDVFRER